MHHPSAAGGRASSSEPGLRVSGAVPAGRDGPTRRRLRGAVTAAVLALGLVVASCGDDAEEPLNGMADDGERAESGEAPDTDDDRAEREDAPQRGGGADPKPGTGSADEDGSGDEDGSEGLGTELPDGEGELAEPPENGLADDVPEECPAEVVDAGEQIAGDFQHVEVAPSDGLAILTCDWRSSGQTIASIEVSFSARLFGTDLADVEEAEEVSLNGVDGHVLHSEETQVTMFQFEAEGLYITGGAIDVEDVDRDDVLELAEAAISSLS